MQRYFLKNNQFEQNSVKITGDDVFHITRVMRQTIGDEFIVCDELQQSFLVSITEVSVDFVKAKIIEKLINKAELPIQVTIAQGLIKADKFEYVIQKSTELGAFAFMPVAMKRSVVKLEPKKEKKKLERWQKIAKEAAEQSHRATVPEVLEVLTFDMFLKLAQHFDVCLFAYEETAKLGEMGQLRQTLESVKSGMKVLVLVGPEGGISEQEEEKLRTASFLPCALGPRILRTETAPLYFLSAVSYALEC